METGRPTNSSITEHPTDLLAAFALDALTDDERTAVEAHLTTCPACRREVARFEQVTAVLPLASPVQPLPRPDLRERILREARSVPQQGRAAAPSTPLRRPARLRALAGWLAAAALFLISLGLGARDLALQQQLQALQRQPATVALAATPDAPGANGQVLLPVGQPGVLTVDHLPPPSAGLVYEAWVIGASGPQPAGTFVTTPDGHGALELTRPAQPGETVAVTSEPTPGRPSPSGKILLKGTA